MYTSGRDEFPSQGGEAQPQRGGRSSAEPPVVVVVGDTSLGRCFSHVHLGEDLRADPGHAGEIPSVGWPGNTSGQPWRGCWTWLERGMSGLPR